VHFGFSEDQELLRKTLRDFLESECPPERVRALWETESGRSRELWAQLAELGVLGVLVDEGFEGMGLDERDLVLLLEEIGRAALAEPVVSTVAVAAPLLAELDGQESWLKRIAVGEAVVAVGHPVNAFVSDAHVADLLLLANGDEELHALRSDQVELVHQPANDPARRLFSVRWNPGPETCMARGSAARTLLAAALDRGVLACAAQQLGVADRLVELAVGYAQQRQQFGRPIGSFQAVKHLLANVKVRLEYARPVVYRAADSVARGTRSRTVDVSHAKLVADAAARLAARVALQVHGAIGYTWEQDVHIWMRRAWSLELAYGQAPFHEERVADFVLAPDTRIGPGHTFAGEK
jgi:alkylation response protein AidB-like acyl-CoA dehydrogenase